MRKLIISAILSLCFPLLAHAQTAPSQAAGYNLVWQDAFSTLNLCKTNIAGCNWYQSGVSNWPSEGAITDPSGTYANINWTSGQGSGITVMSTAANNVAHFHAWDLPVYIEISMAFNPVTGNWPAILLSSISNGGNPTYTGGEADMFEWDSTSPTWFQSTLHVWVNGTDTGSETIHPAPAGITWSNFNTYGLLWTSTQMCSYLNNVLMGCQSITSAPFNTVFAGQESYFLVLSEQEGCAGSSSCPGQASPLNMQVKWVHVFDGLSGSQMRGFQRGTVMQ
jgi:hypothetical protein